MLGNTRGSSDVSEGRLKENKGIFTAVLDVKKAFDMYNRIHCETKGKRNGLVARQK